MFSGTITGIQAGDKITATYASTASAASSPVSYPIEPTLVDPQGKLSNYLVSSTNGTLTVDPASLTLTANNVSRAYGEFNPTLTGTITGLRNNDNITANYSTVATYMSSVGTYSIAATLVDPDGKLSNYLVTTNNGTLSVTPLPILVTADNVARPYGEPNPPLTGKVFGLAPRTGDHMSVSCTTEATISSPEGTYPIFPTLVDPDNKAGNYTVTMADGTLTIAPVTTPIILSVVKTTQTDALITWTSVSNGIYRIQWIPNLNSTTWSNLEPDITATSNITSFADTAAQETPRFYRVLLLSITP